MLPSPTLVPQGPTQDRSEEAGNLTLCNEYNSLAQEDPHHTDEARVALHTATLLLDSCRIESAMRLSLKSVGINTLPAAIGNLVHLKHLELSFNPIDSLPAEISKLSNLRILFTLGCRFRSIPPVLGQLPALSMLSFKSNKLETIADDALAPSLRWLILTDNKLSALPKTIGRLRGLHKLMLTNNMLTALPDELERCTELEMVRAADNRLASLPPFLFAMPRLAWLALAGNPCLQACTTLALSPRAVRLCELELHEELGRGAGGTVRRAMWRASLDAPAVAVKLFNAAASVSDGNPIHEVRAAGALSHASTCRVLGVVAEPLGLVQELLSGYSSLGNPPDFASCTRDTYAAGTAFAPPFAARALAGVAAACAHLHACRFTHGDLYAHNTMVTSQGDAKLCDFGATFCYEALPADAVEAIEVRAFGCLVLELAERMEGGAVRETLDRMAATCMGEIQQRPFFADIAAQLAQLVDQL